MATSGVTELAWFTWVWIARPTPRERARAGHARHALDDLVLQPVLRQPHQRLGGQPDVADVLDLQHLGEEVLEPSPRHVGDVTAGDHDVTHDGRTAQVVEHLGVAVDRLAEELQLVDGRRGVADEVHPGAVAAVLRAGRQQLGEHLGGVAVGEALGRPHVVLVQRVAAGVGVRGPVGATVGEHRDHVVPDRVGVERVGQRPGPAGGSWGAIVFIICGGTSIDIVARSRLVALEVGVEALVDEVTEQRAQLPDVLDAVRPLPLGALPLRGGDVLPAGEAGPVGLDQLRASVGVGLAGGWSPARVSPSTMDAMDVSMVMVAPVSRLCRTCPT